MNKKIGLVIVPCTKGYGWGYVGRSGRWSFWGKSRVDVILQFLNRFWDGS